MFFKKLKHLTKYRAMLTIRLNSSNWSLYFIERSPGHWHTDREYVRAGLGRGDVRLFFHCHVLSCLKKYNLILRTLLLEYI